MKKDNFRIELIGKSITLTSLIRFTSLVFIIFLLVGCSLFGGTNEEAVSVATPIFPPSPTRTPTPFATDTPEPTATESIPTNTPLPPTASTPQIEIVQELANVRGGPGPEYGVLAKITQHQRFDVLAKDPTGEWWKICCVNGQEGWVFAPLVQSENVANVPVDLNIPAVTETPTPLPPTPVPPTSTPVPLAKQAPPPPAAPDPCANIGGDGCKFKLKKVPNFADNGGAELRLQLYFIHSGVEGGQPQGSYWVALFKDGQKVPIAEGVRSVALDKRPGPLGTYNYEVGVHLSQVPGGSVAGNYTIYVLDGSGERDSKDFPFSISGGQGLVHMVFDQR